MKVLSYLAFTCLFLSGGCKQEKSLPSAAPAKEAIAVNATKPLRDNEWAKLIIGSWVSSPTPPQGGVEENCETDNNFVFGIDGSYGTSSDEGNWHLSGNTLTATITASNPDGDIGPPMQKLAKPFVIHSQLISYKARILTTITEGKKDFWYRCPKGTDANP